MRIKAIINLDKFTQNIRLIIDRTRRRVCVPVKADGYGHGAMEIAITALEAGASCLGVATVAEGAELRGGGLSCPILLFSQPHPDEIPEVLTAELTPFVSDSWYIDALSNMALEKGVKLPVHLKIDTGMGRLGCSPEEALPLAKQIAASPALELAGVATHFAVSDSEKEEDIAFTQTQIVRFKEAVQSIRDAGIDTGIVHAANSGAVLLHNESWFDMVRPGILSYGYPCVKVDDFSRKIKPVMELRAAVSLIKKVKKGESVSYGRTWTAPRDTHIAVISAGYGDGLVRLASNKWQVRINGKPYPLVGRICMDQCCADIGDGIGVNRWDEAVLFGGEAPDAAHSAAELAEAVGTIPYEITCNINKRVPRQCTMNNVQCTMNNKNNGDKR